MLNVLLKIYGFQDALIYFHCLEGIMDPETSQLSAEEPSDTQ